MGTLESHINKPLGKTAVVIVNVISLVEKLVLQIPAVSLVGLINGQLGNLLRSLLSPLPKQVMPRFFPLVFIHPPQKNLN